jgi:hypothetical protein
MYSVIYRSPHRWGGLQQNTPFNSSVYYVFKLESNIIILEQLTERGCKIMLEENYLWGYDRQRHLIMKVDRRTDSTTSTWIG